MQGHVVFITGGSSGIGAATAKACYRRGAYLVLMARNHDRLQQFVQESAFDVARVLIYPGDVRIEAHCQAAIEATMAQFGKLNVLISNAGISMRSAFLETQPELLHQVMDTNFWGLVHMTRYALPHVIAAKGSLIGISSITGIKGLPGRTAYSASKFAMHVFLESLRMEHAAYPIHIGIVAPGFTRTPIRQKALTASGSVQENSPRDESRMMTPEQVADAIIDAITKKSPLVVLSTKGKALFWLNKFFPKWVERQIYHSMKKEPHAPFR